MIMLVCWRQEVYYTFCFSNVSPGASLNSCLHVNAKGPDNLFYKVAGQIGVYGLMVSMKQRRVKRLSIVLQKH